MFAFLLLSGLLSLPELWNWILGIAAALIVWWVQRLVALSDSLENRLTRLESDLQQSILADQGTIKALVEKMDILFLHMKETLQRIEREVDNLKNQ